MADVQIAEAMLLYACAILVASSVVALPLNTSSMAACAWRSLRVQDAGKIFAGPGAVFSSGTIRVLLSRDQVGFVRADAGDGVEVGHFDHEATTPKLVIVAAHVDEQRAVAGHVQCRRW